MSEHPKFCPNPKECDLLAMKAINSKLFERRWKEACEVIDALAVHLGIYSKGLCLYTLDSEDSSPLITKLNEWENRSGDKVKLKKRIDELENEKEVLLRLLGRGG